MKQSMMILSALAFLAPIFLFARPASAAGQCYCYTEFGLASVADATCTDVPLPACTPTNNKYTCEWQADASACGEKVLTWKKSNDEFNRRKAVQEQNQFSFAGKIIPDCALKDKLDLQDTGNPCGDVSIFVLLLINVSRYLFSIIGALALAAFIYGGFVLILSQGNTEKIQHGRDIVLAAVIGLVVAFGGYVIIRFLGEAIKLKGGLGLS